MEAQATKVNCDRSQEILNLLVTKKEKIENQLNESREKLRKELNGETLQTAIFDNFCIPGTVGNRIRTLEQCLLNIAFAWQRLEAGNYGFCQDCGRPIPEKRLMAIPEARRCLECQTAYV